MRFVLEPGGNFAVEGCLLDCCFQASHFSTIRRACDASGGVALPNGAARRTFSEDARSAAPSRIRARLPANLFPTGPDALSNKRLRHAGRAWSDPFTCFLGEPLPTI